jgi:hypothetical protein
MPPEQGKIYQPLLDVHRAYLNAGFDEARDTLGSFTAYEKEAFGIGEAEVRRLKRELLL